MSRYRYACCVSFGGDKPTAEHEVEVTFSMAWGSPESGRFGPIEGYDPGAPDEVEDIHIELIDGKPRPWAHAYMSDEDLADLILNELDEADLQTSALEDEAARAFDPDTARDRRRDEGLEHVSGPVRRALTTIEESLK